MSCEATETTHSVNADLFDLISDSYSAEQQLSNSLALPCPFSTAALRVQAAVALALHGLLLLLAGLQLVRLLFRFRSSSPERWWTCVWHTFAGRYLLLVLVMSGSAVVFTAVRLLGLAGSFGVEQSPLLSISFSPRAGATYVMSVVLLIVSTSFIAAVSFSVNNTVHAALAAGRASAGPQGNASSLPWIIRHFSLLALGLFVWNTLVWCVLFLLPTASHSASSSTSQQVTALLLISLGNISYWILARAVTVATHSISAILNVDPPLHPALTGTARLLKVQPVAPAGTGISSGLNSAQIESRNRARDRCSMASAVVRNMMLLHLTASVAFFVLCIVLPSTHLQAYWIFANLSYWAVVCLLRLQVLSLPQPTT